MIKYNYEYAQCDECNCELTEETGCHSYWYHNNIITVCDYCSLEILR
jgi:hypothetical protein